VRLVELLTEPGVMRVTATAESEANALQLIDEQDFEVLVVDVELRPGSGISVVRHARAHWRGEFRPTIIVLTNFSLPTVRDRCLAAGADHFLDKMRQFDQVHQIIRRRAV
jgi:CheY-like chemotaxis protein